MAYNGWANRTTWSISLHINNDYKTYQRAVLFMKTYDGKNPFQDFVDAYGYISTSDGTLYDSEFANKTELNAMMREMV